ASSAVPVASASDAAIVRSLAELEVAITVPRRRLAQSTARTRSCAPRYLRWSSAAEATSSPVGIQSERGRLPDQQRIAAAARRVATVASERRTIERSKRAGAARVRMGPPGPFEDR